MEEPEKKELSTCDKKVPGETLEESVDCEGQVQMEGSFSEEFVGEGGACNNGKDVMVEVLGSDVYIDGVCTRGSDAELNEEVGAGRSVEGAEDLGKDVRPAGLGNGNQAQSEGSQAVEPEEPKSENVALATKLDAVALEILERGRAVVGSDKFDIVSKQGESLLDNRAQKEVGTGASDFISVVNTTSGKIEVSAVEDVGVEHVNALDAGVADCKLTSTRCDSAIGRLLTVSSVGRENVESKRAEKDNQQEINLGDHGAKEDKNDVTLKTLDEQKKEACSCDKVEFEETLNSDEEQPMGIDEVGDSSNGALRVIPGAEVAVDRSLLNSEEKSIEKDHMTDTSQASSDTRQEMEVEDQPESIEIMNHTADIQDDTRIADQGYFALVGAGREECHDKAPLSADDQKSEFTKCAQQSVTSDVTQVESNTKQNVEEQAGIPEQVGSLGGQETEVEEFNDADQRKTTDGKTMKRASMKPGSSGAFYQSSYLLPAENEGEFSVSDMVWGKVRSHPWWPGQIFDPSDASEKAMKHFKRDCYLVAYFGDRTFAWNEESQLKPFRTHFSSIAKHSTSESFQNAVECALDEVTRRVEFGLACCCIPKDTYDTIKFQTIENTGIRQELSFRDGVDESLNASSFSPDKLIEYLKTLSEFPTGDFDHLELVIAKAQLLAFYRLKGFSCLPELQYCGGLDNDMDSSIDDGEKNSSEVIEHAIPVSKNDGQTGTGNLKSQNSSRHKRKHNLKEGMSPTKKQRSLSELMGGTPDSPDGDYWSDEKVTDDLVFPSLSKKRKTIDHYPDSSGMQDGRKTISLAKVSNTTKQSFKIGECIRRVASQLTGSPSMLKCSGGDKSHKTDGSIDGFSGNGSDLSFQNIEEAQRSSSVVTTDYSSLDDLLSSLQWVAEEPLGDYSFLNAIVSFFSDFRNSIIVADDSWKEILPMDKVGTKRKKPPIAGTPEAFEFEDMSDTYWTDRVIDNGSEEQPSRRNRKKDYQHDPAEPEGTVKVSRRSNSRRRYSDSSHPEAPEKPAGYIDENSPAELVMNFAELDSVPTETSLNKMFKRFGPLKESETEVDRVSSRARVVFKKCADAEVACSSAKKFNIFGPILVNYQLNYTPSALFNASSVATTQDQEMHLDLANFEVNAV